MRSKNGCDRTSRSEGLPMVRPANLPPIGAWVSVRDRGEPGWEACGCPSREAEKCDGRVGVVISYDGPNICMVHGILTSATQAKTKGNMVCVQFDTPSPALLELWGGLRLKVREQRCFTPQNLEVIE